MNEAYVISVVAIGGLLVLAFIVVACVMEKNRKQEVSNAMSKVDEGHDRMQESMEMQKSMLATLKSIDSKLQTLCIK